MKKITKQIIACAMSTLMAAGGLSFYTPSYANAAEMESTRVETESSIQLQTELTTEPFTTLQSISMADNNWTKVENDSDLITFDSGWEKYSEGGHSKGNAHKSDAVGAMASFTFTGTGIQWIGQTDTNFTKAKVYLDDVLVGMPDSNKTPGYQQIIYTMVGIPYGEHTFQIESQGPPNSSHNINFIELDALAYTTDQTPVVPTSLSVENIPGKMEPGDTRQLEASVMKDDSFIYSKNINYTSSNSKVAEISQDGLITANSDGETEITVTCNNLEKSFMVKVSTYTQQPMRRIIDSTHPLFYHHLYRQGHYQDLGQTEGSYQGGLDIQKFWDVLDNSMTPNTKQYQAILIHASDQINDTASTREWYIKQMEKTVKDQIPFFLMISNSYTDYPFDNDWLAQMYETYPNMLGVAYSENHASVWQNHGGYRSNEIASKLELSARYGGYVIFADTNNYDEYMESTLKSPTLMAAAKKYKDNFIILPKYTSQWSQAGYNSYQSVAMGTWLSGYAGNWGSLIDSWQWGDLYYNNDAFSQGKTNVLGGGEECRLPFSFPELNFPIRMLSEANSGATVFSFEHPFYSTAVAAGENEPAYTTPAFDNAIVQAMNLIIDNHSSTRDEVMEQTKVAFFANKGTLNKTAEAGVNLIKALYGDGNVNHKGNRSDKKEMLMMQLSGRYHIIPSIPALASEEDLNVFTEHNIQILDKDSVLEKFKKNTINEVKNGTDTATQQAVQEYFNQYYPQISTGDGYVQKIGSTWFTYNNRWTGYPVTSLVQSAQLQNTEFSNGTQVTYDPYTYLNITESSDKVAINFNNYFVDKNSIWENYTQRWDGDYNLLFQDYLINHYIPKDATLDNVFKTASITWSGLKNKPEIQNLTGLQGQFDTPKEVWDAQSGTYTLEISANGYMNFEVTLADNSLLKDAIALASETDRTPYTLSSLAILDKAIAEGNELVANRLSITEQSTIDTAVLNIQNAVNDLQLRPAIVTDLNTALDNAAKVERANYTSETLSSLDKAVASGQALIDSQPPYTKQSEVNNAALSIQNAIKGLQLKPANLDDLHAAIKAAKQLDRNNYQPDSLSSLDKAVASGQALIDSQPLYSRQSEVDNAALSIQNAIKGLQLKPANLDGLHAAIKASKQLDRNKYQPDSLSSLDKAVASGQALIDSHPLYSRQSEVDNAALSIQNAIKGLQLKPASLDGLHAAIKAAKQLDRNKYTPGSLKALDGAVAAAESIVKSNPTIDSQKTVNDATNAINNATKQLVLKPLPPKKGTKVTIGNFQYKVTKSSSKSGTVSLERAKKKTYSKLSIPATVKINGFTFKVTSIADKAFMNNKKLSSVVIGSNIVSIGKQSFRGCSKLKNINIKSSAIKKVGKDTFHKIHKKAVIKVPAKKLSAYKKIFKNKGQANSVIIKKG